MNEQFRVQDDNYRERVEGIFASAPFIERVGYRLAAVGPGWCETELDVAAWHMQQNGVAHAGVLATMADHTSGAAAATLLAADQHVLTVEFKMNLLRGATGSELFCRAEVVRPGKTITAVEANVYSEEGNEKKLVARMLSTMAAV